MNQSAPAFTEIRLQRNLQCDLTFEGVEVAAVSSDPEKIGGRWTELYLYVTKGGRFVAQSVGRSTINGEGDISNVQVFDRIGDVADFYTDRGRVTWLSQKMYAAIRRCYPSFDSSESVE